MGSNLKKSSNYVKKEKGERRKEKGERRKEKRKRRKEKGERCGERLRFSRAARSESATPAVQRRLVNIGMFIQFHLAARIRLSAKRLTVSYHAVW
jgi:hypothetical protein